MNPTIEKIVARFVDGLSLEEHETAMLLDAMRDDPEIIIAINDNRSIDSLLESINLEDAQFVDECVKQFQRLDLDVAVDTSDESSRSRLPIANDLARPSLPAQDSHLNPSVESTETTYRPPTEFKPSPSSNWFAWSLAVAAAILILVTAFAFWMTPEKVRNVVESSSPPSLKEDGDLVQSPGDPVAPNDNDLVNNEPEQPDTQVKQPPNAVEVVDNSTNEPPQRPNEPSSEATEKSGFARLFATKAKWNQQPVLVADDLTSGVPINNQHLQLTSGVALVEFENDVELRLMDKSDAEILGEDSIMLNAGTYIVTVPDQLDTFSLKAGSVNIHVPDGAKFQVSVTPESIVETYVLDGAISVMESESPQNSAVQLARNELNQALWSPAVADKKMPSK